MIIEHKDIINKPENTPELKTNMIHECRICNKKYSYRHWHEHMRTVHGDVNLTCDQCNRTFKCQKYLYRHMKKIHTVKLGKYTRKVQLKNVAKFNCKQCPKTFKSGDCLNKHVKNCHSQKVRCQICDSVLNSAVYLNSHMRRVHCDSGQKSKCQICGKQFKSKRQVRIHVRNTHEKLCLKCGKTYTSAYHCHIKSCNIVTQNVEVDIRNHGNEAIDNDRADIGDSEFNVNSNDDNMKVDVHDNVKVDVHDNVKIEVSDQLNINNNSHFKTLNISRDINKNNVINQDDMKNIDVDYIGLKNGDLSEEVKIGKDNAKFCYIDEDEDEDEDIVTIHGNINNVLKEDSMQRDVSDHINENSIDKIIKGDMIEHFCKVCNKKLKSEKRVRIHMKKAHCKSLPPNKCQYCGKLYVRLKYFGVHVKKCSTKVKTESKSNKLESKFKIDHDFEVNGWAFAPL